MSTLLDRYLNAVEEALPRDVAKTDIVAEIRDELQSQIDESADEIEVIKAYGHPRVVAARYGRVQYVIGPDLFPFYWLTMRNVLIGGIALVLAGGGLVAVLANNGKIFFDALDIAWHTALWIAAVVTITFAVAEQVPERGSARIGPFSRDWDPARLPLPGTLPPVKSFAALVEFVANFLMLLVLLDVRSQHIPLDALVANILSAGNAALTPAWYPAYYATIAGSAIVAGSAMTVFLRPNLTIAHELLRTFASAVTIAGIAVTLARGPLIVAASSGWNTSAQCCLVAAIVVLLVSVATSLREIRRARLPA